MPKTAKIKCECGWQVVVEGQTSWASASAMADEHIDNNREHTIYGLQTVWTDNPYIPPSE